MTKTKSQTLKSKRNIILHKQHKLVNHEYENKLLEEIEAIENSKDDSHRMFKAVKVIQNKKENSDLIVKRGDELLCKPEDKIEAITNHFKSVFQSDNITPIPHIKPQELDNSFNADEIAKAVKSLKNNKSAGCDEIRSEQIKYAPCTFQYIADILNDVAKTGNYPVELTNGLLIPLQKPGKVKGPPENLRPVILQCRCFL